ncbi:hypothetical protein CEXT_96421 [Caerostris extrusa]|uniref:Uncharacterized protein n=1 Tax=Caerostris extrusa TaxID=172846 RepID=A0AAV4VTE6_CAEEX|nr:hypothetical protein CEXT_96421 [Caerostris extrusa]
MVITWKGQAGFAIINSKVHLHAPEIPAYVIYDWTEQEGSQKLEVEQHKGVSIPCTPFRNLASDDRTVKVEAGKMIHTKYFNGRKFSQKEKNAEIGKCPKRRHFRNFEHKEIYILGGDRALETIG